MAPKDSSDHSPDQIGALVTLVNTKYMLRHQPETLRCFISLRPLNNLVSWKDHHPYYSHITDEKDKAHGVICPKSLLLLSGRTFQTLRL